MKKHLIFSIFLLISTSCIASPYHYDSYIQPSGYVIEQPNGNKTFVRRGLGNTYIIDDNSGQNTYIRPSLGGYVIDNGSGFNTYIRPY